MRRLAGAASRLLDAFVSLAVVSIALVALLVLAAVLLVPVVIAAGLATLVAAGITGSWSWEAFAVALVVGLVAAVVVGAGDACGEGRR